VSRPLTASPTAGDPQRDRRPSAVRAWDRFFFNPADPRPLAAVRIAVGLLLLWDFAWLGADLRDWLGPAGWADPAVVRSMLPPGGWSLWLDLPGGLIVPVYVLGLVVLTLLTLGLGSVIVAPLAWVLVVSTNRRVPVMLFGFDNMVATWMLYLAVCGASGRAWSLDRWLARRRGSAGPIRPAVSANLGLRLIQLHLCLIYASAGLAKLQGTPWWDGTAVGMLLGNSEFRTVDLGFLADYPGLLALATHGTVFLEILYPILVWFRGWRPWVLAGALGMHLGIALGMGLTEFSLAMLAGNLAFVPGDWLARLGLGRGGSVAPGVESGESPAPASAASGSPRASTGRDRDRARGRAPR
jgi:hypothetical protein